MTIIQIRRGTTEQWTESLRVLRLGELGLDTTLDKLKAGDGINLWADLPFIVKGDTGADSTVPGPQGPQGLKGDTGDTGPGGADSTVAGPQGPQGLKGDTGDTGPAGADSTVAGPQGPQGLKGDTGDTGLKGDTGDTGPAGADSTVAGPQGPQGLKGDTGDTGPQGPQGLKGDTGDIGAAGLDGSSTFSGTTDAVNAGVTIDKIAYPAITMLNVTNSGSLAYVFGNQYGGSNPTIYAISGTTIGFKLDILDHPFLIRFSGSNYDTGLIHVSITGVISTGSNAQGQTSGTLYWQVPYGISGDYGYLCSFHSGMAGIIKVKDISIL